VEQEEEGPGEEAEGGGVDPKILEIREQYEKFRQEIKEADDII
jgi:hypothetical protein